MLSQIGAAAGVADHDIAKGEHQAHSVISALPAHQGEPINLRKFPYFQVHLPVSFSGDRMAGEGTVYNLSPADDQEHLRRLLQTLEISPGTEGAL